MHLIVPLPTKIGIPLKLDHIVIQIIGPVVTLGLKLTGSRGSLIIIVYKCLPMSYYRQKHEIVPPSGALFHFIFAENLDQNVSLNFQNVML